MKNLVAAIAVALCLPIETYAQRTPCEPRVLLGAAAGFLRGDIPVDPELAGGGRFGLAKITGVSPEGSIHASVPFASNWSVMSEFAMGSMDVLLERDATETYVQQKTGDDLTLRRLDVGVVRYDAGQFACVYWSARFGIYRFAYRDVTLNAPGGAGAIGVEVPVSDSGSVFVETELYLVVTNARPPLTPAGVLANLRPAIGFRYRF